MFWENVRHWSDFLIVTKRIFCSCRYVFCSASVISPSRYDAHANVEPVKTTHTAFSFFSRPPRYQSYSRTARISFLHNIRGHSWFYTFVVGNISKRSIKRLNKVWAIRFDTVISGFRKAFRRPFHRSIRVTRKVRL